MPQEADAATGNFVTQEDARFDPLAPVVYRGAAGTNGAAVTVADGTTKPLPGSVLWLLNPGYRSTARVFVVATGTTPAGNIRPYVRSGGSSGQVGSLATVALAGTPNFDACFDVAVNGDDLAVLMETLTGTTPSVSMFVSWR